MDNTTRDPARPATDDLWTVAAIAICAFVLTDLGHECVGHGGAWILLGGRQFVLTTTRLVAGGPGVNPRRIFAGNPHGDLFGRLFSIGGPLGNFLIAGLSLLWLRLRTPRQVHGRLFLWLAAAFSVFWGVAYMVDSGITGAGDWAELSRGLAFNRLFRIALVVLGILLYRATVRMLRSPLKITFNGISTCWYPRLRAVLLVSFFSAAGIASLGALFDPRGPVRILHDALPETLIANLGIFFALVLLKREAWSPQEQNGAVTLSHGWIAAAILVTAGYALILGPGVMIRL